MVSVDRIKGLSSGLAVKAPCRVATTTNIPLSGLFVVDTEMLTSGDAVLVKNQTNSVDNGVWVASTSSWSRRSDADKSNDLVNGTLFTVTEGTQSSQIFQLVATNPVLPGTTPLAFIPKVPLNLDASTGASLIGATDGAGGTLWATVQGFINKVQDKGREIVSVKDFGAVGDGITDDTVAIQKAVAHLKLLGGGTLVAPDGTYIYHVETPVYSSSNPGNYAVTIDFDNFTLKGSGTFKAKNTDGFYGFLLLSKLPVENGTPSLHNIHLDGITVDGNSNNAFPVIATRTPTIYASGLVDSSFSNMTITNSGMYGIGLQNGGHQNVAIRDSTFRHCARNAVDVKNNGSVNTAISMTNLLIDDCSWADFDDEAASMLSVTGVGCQLDNIRFINPPTGDRTIDRVLRIKPGSEGFSQGIGARATTVSNIQILMGASYAASLTCAIEVGCEKAQLSNIVIKGSAPLGISIEQPWCNVVGGVIDGPDVGVYLRDRVIAYPAQPYAAGTDCSIVGLTVLNAVDTGVRNNAARNSIAMCNFDLCGIGIDNLGSKGINATCALNSFTNCTVPLRGDASTGQSWFANKGAINPIFRVILESGLANILAVDFANTMRFYGNSGVTEVLRLRSLVNGVNYWDMYPSTAGTGLQLLAAGADTDIDMRFAPKGAGCVRFGTHTANADAAITGYITIKDASGTVRKLAVIT